MRTVRRLMAVSALLAAAVMVSPHLQGDSGSGKDPAPRGPLAGTTKSDELLKQFIGKRFASPGVLTYESAAGEKLFALKLQPPLTARHARPRDVLVVVDTTASQAGPFHGVQRLLVRRLFEQLTPQDRVALWTVNATTGELTQGFVMPRAADGKLSDKAETALQKLDKVVPLGVADLKAGLQKALAAFENHGDRQQAVLYLGDGMSALNPFTPADRAKLAQDMVAQQVAFFPVIIGPQMDVLDTSALATGTGGTFLRFDVSEKDTEIARRFAETLGKPVLYDAQVQLPAEVAEYYPTKLPPLRGDAPTLVVGKLSKALANMDCQITGTQYGNRIAVTQKEVVHGWSADCFFLSQIAAQWQEAKDQPALMQADYTLAFAFEHSAAAKDELLLQGRQAVRGEKFDLAAKLFAQARDLDPNDPEAAAGARLADFLKKNPNRKENLLGKQDPGARPEDQMLRQTQERVQIEEQRVRMLVEETVRQARRELRASPEESVRRLKLLLEEVQRDPNIGDQLRTRLGLQVENELRLSQQTAERFLIERQEREALVARAKAAEALALARRENEEKLRTALAQFDQLLQEARFDAAEIQARLIRNAFPNVPVATSLQFNSEFQAQRKLYEETIVAKQLGFRDAMQLVDESGVPVPDEPPMTYPQPGARFFRTKKFRNWMELSDFRKKRWGGATLGIPGGTEGAKVDEMLKILNTPTNYFERGYKNNETLDTVLNKIADDFKINIVTDIGNIRADAGDPEFDLSKFEVDVRGTKNVSLSAALTVLLNGPFKGEAEVADKVFLTWYVHTDHVVVTTVDTVFKKGGKPVRVYPVLELITLGGPLGDPIPGGILGGGGFGGGGIGGGIGGAGGGLGGLGGGGLGGLGGGGLGGLGGGGLGGLGGGGLGGLGGGGLGGLGGLGGGGLGGLGGGGLGGLGGGGLGGLGGGLGGGIGGGIGGGLGGGIGGAGGGIGGGFNGGQTFGPPAARFVTRAFNSRSLMELIERTIEVNPSQWRISDPLQSLNDAGGGGAGPGAGGGAGGGLGGGPNQNEQEPINPLVDSTIEYYDPVYSFIIKAPSRVNTRLRTRYNLEGGEAAAFRNNRGDNRRGGDLAGNLGGGNKNDGGKLLKDDNNKRKNDMPADRIWDQALAKGPVDLGLTIATTDLFAQLGMFNHSAEFLKATLRHGTDIRPWMFEALAVALEATNGSSAEIEQALLSAADLQPTNGAGFLQAAKAMGKHQKWLRAIDFCRHSAAQKPYHPQSYVLALDYAYEARDTAAMQWAAENLLARDWPSRDLDLHAKAKQQLEKLSGTLAKEGRAQDAAQLLQAARKPARRDMVVKLLWQGDADLDLDVAEPVGTACNMHQPQTSAGGTLFNDFVAPARQTEVYSLAEGFSGEYRIAVKRQWGQPVGKKAVLEIIRHQGTPDEHVQREVVVLDQNVKTVTVKLDQGRRTGLAEVPSLAAYRKLTAAKDDTKSLARSQLSALAMPVVEGKDGYVQAAIPVGRKPGQEWKPLPGTEELMSYGTATASHSDTVAINTVVVPSADGKSFSLTLQPIYMEMKEGKKIRNPLIPSVR